MNLTIFTTKRQVLSFIAKRALVITIFVALVLVINARIAGEIKTLSSSATEKKKAALILEKRNELLDTTKADLEKVGEGATLIKRAYPPQDNVLPFVEVLETLATQNSLVQTIKFAEPTPNTEAPVDFSVARINYTITITGNSENLINYITAFERLPYATVIKDINLTAPAATGGWNTQATASMNAQLFIH